MPYQWAFSLFAFIYSGSETTFQGFVSCPFGLEHWTESWMSSRRSLPISLPIECVSVDLVATVPFWTCTRVLVQILSDTSVAAFGEVWPLAEFYGDIIAQGRSQGIVMALSIFWCVRQLDLYPAQTYYSCMHVRHSIYDSEKLLIANLQRFVDESLLLRLTSWLDNNIQAFPSSWPSLFGLLTRQSRTPFHPPWWVWCMGLYFPGHWAFVTISFRETCTWFRWLFCEWPRHSIPDITDRDFYISTAVASAGSGTLFDLCYTLSG